MNEPVTLSDVESQDVVDINKIATEAQYYARYFRHVYITANESNGRAINEELFSGPASNKANLLGALADFVYINGGAKIDNFDKQKDHEFGAWLCCTEDWTEEFKKYKILLYPQQMEKLSESNDFPPIIQKIRCIIHELGHILMSPPKPDPEHSLPGTKEYLAKTQSPTNEEKAWIFTFCFFATIWGQHAFQIREKGDADNTLIAWV